MIPSIEQYISSVAGKFVVSSADSNKGINGFVFDVEAQDEVIVEAEATDHYVEANYAIQDHVAHRPKTITLKGYVGELKDEFINKGLSFLTKIQSLGDVAGLAPNFAQQSAQAYSKIEGVVSKVDSYINQANNLTSIFNDHSTTANSQQQAFRTLESFADANRLCTVTTPFGTFEDMLVTRITAIQREDTAIVSDFMVTLKQIRTAKTISGTPFLYSGRAADAMAQSVVKGQVVGTTTDISALSLASGLVG